MGNLFGIKVESNFDPGIAERRNRLWWPFLGGVFVSLLCYSLLGKSFATKIFQCWVLTSLFYGENFYVREGSNLSKSWLWKAIFMTTPLHLVLLFCILIGDKILPGVMMKALGFLPLIFLGLMVETIFAQKVIGLFKPEA